jgi:anaerobic selenocysteine-containing dehydrogenase
MHNTEAVKKAFEKTPFKVSFSSFMDDTTEMADLVLPNHVWLERFEDVPVTAGLAKPVIGLSKPVIEPLFNTKHTGDVIIFIAKKMGGSIGAAFPWDNYEVCIKETLGEKWGALEKNGCIEASADVPEPWNNGFQTDTGKFKFPDIDRLMTNHPSLPEGEESAYPLLLIPFDSMRLSSGYTGSTPFMVKIVSNNVLVENDILIEINPETAKKYGFSEGAYAQLITPIGTAKVKMHLSDGIMPDIVAMPKGLGHSGYDKYLAGKGENYNRLVKSVEDPASGFDTAWGIRAKLAKA